MLCPNHLAEASHDPDSPSYWPRWIIGTPKLPNLADLEAIARNIKQHMATTNGGQPDGYKLQRTEFNRTPEELARQKELLSQIAQLAAELLGYQLPWEQYQVAVYYQQNRLVVERYQPVGHPPALG